MHLKGSIKPSCKTRKRSIRRTHKCIDRTHIQKPHPAYWPAWRRNNWLFTELCPKEIRAMTADLRASQNKEMREKIRAYHAPPQYQTVDVTWGKEAESLKRCIIGSLREHVQPDQPWMTDEQASHPRPPNQRNPCGRFFENAQDSLCLQPKVRKGTKTRRAPSNQIALRQTKPASKILRQPLAQVFTEGFCP